MSPYHFSTSSPYSKTVSASSGMVDVYMATSAVAQDEDTWIKIIIDGVELIWRIIKKIRS